MKMAKRAGPADVAPVTIGELRFEAVPWGKARGLGQNGGIVAAIDVKSGKEVWTLKVYTIEYDSKLESDVQDLFITELAKSRNGRHLVVTDEHGRRFEVDVEQRTAKPLP